MSISDIKVNVVFENKDKFEEILKAIYETGKNLYEANDKVLDAQYSLNKAVDLINKNIKVQGDK